MQGNKHIANRTDDDLRAEVEAALQTALPHPADELTVPGADHSPDADMVIAVAAATARDRAEDVPEDSIIIEVEDRIVVLTGTVTSVQERLAADRAPAHVHGDARIDNLLAISQLP